MTIRRSPQALFSVLWFNILMLPSPKKPGGFFFNLAPLGKFALLWRAFLLA